jgi:Co/Zn/Cd efflux system component
MYEGFGMFLVGWMMMVAGCGTAVCAALARLQGDLNGDGMWVFAVVAFAIFYVGQFLFHKSFEG